MIAIVGSRAPQVTSRLKYHLHDRALPGLVYRFIYRGKHGIAQAESRFDLLPRLYTRAGESARSSFLAQWPEDRHGRAVLGDHKPTAGRDLSKQSSGIVS
ncbi:MAG: hypothetical protein OXJ90_04445 [Spirochaetaceae bacterium]|nr:hypothetical protein [Spirochaetaceae bacterium]